MPIDPQLYGPDWPDISARIRERDGHRCKFCGLPQHARGWRDDQGEFHALAPAYAGADQGAAPVGRKAIVIRLTVAHLDHNPANNADENLAALCQRCHLRHDRKQHQANAAHTRRWRRKMSGQLEMELGK